MSHLVFPVHSIIPGVSDRLACLDWLGQLSRLGWNGEIVLLVQGESFSYNTSFIKYFKHSTLNILKHFNIVFLLCTAPGVPPLKGKGINWGIHFFIRRVRAFFTVGVITRL